MAGHSAPGDERPLTILLVDDEPLVRSCLRDWLRLDGHTVATADSTPTALAWLEDHRADLMITDILMPVLDGLELIRRVVKRGEPPGIMVVTAYAEVHSAIEALQLGAFDYMLKPLRPRDLLNRVRRYSRELRLAAEAEQVRQQNRRLARLAAVGRLAGGVAHRINNPVTFIRGHVQILQQLARRADRAPDGDAAAVQAAERLRQRLPASLGTIEDGLDRIERIVDGLLACAGEEPTAAPAAADLNECVEEALHLQDLDEGRIVLLRQFDDDLPAVPVATERLIQVVLCLVSNAVRAMVEIPHPVLRVVTGRTADGAVCLTVEDAGPGIPTGLRDRVFEPFFTTREVESALGLGLALVHGVVCLDHEGQVSIDDSDLGGANVTITLPPVPVLPENRDELPTAQLLS